MSDCRRTEERLTPYVDRALDERERADVERHLEACPPCADDAAREAGGRAALRQGADRLRNAPLPPGLRSRCEALARAHCGTRRGAWLRTWPARVALGAAAAVAMIVLFSVVTERSNALLAAQLTADHAKCFGLFVDAATPAADAAAVEQSLAGDYGWNVHVPPSSASGGVQLVGARRCFWADGGMPHIMYRINGEHVSLFVLEGVARMPADVTTLGYRSRIWSRGTTTYVLVWHADEGPDGGNVAAGAEYVMREAR